MDSPAERAVDRQDIPTIALVGRPNVGKSTLFNRLTKTRDALVADFPGLTRDRQYGTGRVGGWPYVLVDTGGLSGMPETLDAAMASQTQAAVDEADLVVFLVDGREGLIEADREIADRLRRSATPVLLAVNKADGIGDERAALEFHELGIASVIAISAAHNRGVRRMVELAADALDVPAEARDGAEELSRRAKKKPNKGWPGKRGGDGDGTGRADPEAAKARKARGAAEAGSSSGVDDEGTAGDGPADESYGPDGIDATVARTELDEVRLEEDESSDGMPDPKAVHEVVSDWSGPDVPTDPETAPPPSGRPESAAAGRARADAPDDGPPDPMRREDTPPVIGFVGRPNVGKSTLVNRLLGEERVIAYDRPGTTRDTVSIPFERGGSHYTLVDTAGVRRRGKIAGEKIEVFSVIKTLQAIEQANVCVLLLDATEGLTEQDLSLLSFVIDAGRALVVAVNKWDGLDNEAREAMRETLERRAEFLSFTRIHFVSALHGSGVDDLFKSIDRAHRSAFSKLPTPRLTRLLELATTQHQPPVHATRRIKLLYAHQGGVNPPIIVVHGRQADKLPGSYVRYLTTFYMKALKLFGTPLRLEFRQGANPFAARAGKGNRPGGKSGGGSRGGAGGKGPGGAGSGQKGPKGRRLEGAGKGAQPRGGGRGGR